MIKKMFLVEETDVKQKNMQGFLILNCCVRTIIYNAQSFNEYNGRNKRSKIMKYFIISNKYTYFLFRNGKNHANKII